MEEILHHLRCTKPVVNTGIFAISTGAEISEPSTVYWKLLVPSPQNTFEDDFPFSKGGIC